MLRTGRSHDRAGRLDDAAAAYEQAIRLAEQSGERAVLVEALRRQGVVHHRRNEPVEAQRLCERSYEAALELEDRTLAGEALNALAGFNIQAGEIASARATFLDALALATGDRKSTRLNSSHAD